MLICAQKGVLIGLHIIMIGKGEQFLWIICTRVSIVEIDRYIDIIIYDDNDNDILTSISYRCTHKISLLCHGQIRYK